MRLYQRYGLLVNGASRGTIRLASSSFASFSTTSTPFPMMIGMNFTRSKRLIEEKIMRRVKERDRMIVDGVQAKQRDRLDGGSVFRFLTELLPQYIGFRPPSKALLDSEFPVKAINWERIKNPPKNRVQITWFGRK